jgi:two-component system sensor histidine kinase DesK
VGELREVFAWTIREGVTNVIRHSAAHTCTVTLEADRVVICDDGRGAGEESRGTGLAGLAERAASVGAELRTHAVQPSGFAVEVIRQRRP